MGTSTYENTEKNIDVVEALLLIRDELQGIRHLISNSSCDVVEEDELVNALRIKTFDE